MQEFDKQKHDPEIQEILQNIEEFDNEENNKKTKSQKILQNIEKDKLDNQENNSKKTKSQKKNARRTGQNK